jgi:hypothetical protein
MSKGAKSLSVKGGMDPNGLINYLRRKAGDKNLHDEGIVIATASSQFPDRAFDNETYGPKNVLELSAATRFISQNQPDAWLCLEFRDLTIRPTAYAIRSHVTPVGWNHPKSWVLELSMDGQKWTVVDRKQDNDDLNGPGCVGKWPIANAMNSRYVRLRLTDKNHKPQDPEWCYLLEVSSFEVYGTVVEE